MLKVTRAMSYIELLDNIEDASPSNTANTIKCQLTVTDTLAEVLVELDNAELVDSTYTINGDVYNTKEVHESIGKTIHLEIFRAGAPLLLAVDFDEFLERNNTYSSIPSEYYIIDESLYNKRDGDNAKIKAYEDIVKFIKLMILICDHEIKKGDRVIGVVFLHKNRIEIKTEYKQCDIDIPLDGLLILEELFGNGEHIEQKKSLFKETLSTFLSPVKNDRLSYLLKNFPNFAKEFNENYHLFVSDFSFDEVRCEYEERKRGYLIGLNNILSSVQTKMLGIPVALAVAAFKLNSIVSFESFLASLLIILSVACYWIMMWILIRNQRHSLDSMKEEFQGQMNRFQKQYPKQYTEIISISNSLNERYDEQLSNLKIFNIINNLMFIIVAFIFIYSLPWNGFNMWDCLKYLSKWSFY